MKPIIYPYQYNAVKKHIFHLLNTYHSVNDLKMIKNIQEETRFLIKDHLKDAGDGLDTQIDTLMDIKLSKSQCEKVLDHLKEYVIPFTEPTQKQIEKTFRKVKKLRVPSISDGQYRESTFIGWNEISSQRKYILYYDMNDALQGFYGDLSPQTVKGFCNICNTESDVSLFLNKSKTGSDDRYTKKGDYICRDSEKCNQQISDIGRFHQFINKIF